MEHNVRVRESTASSDDPFSPVREHHGDVIDLPDSWEQGFYEFDHDTVFKFEGPAEFPERSEAFWAERARVIVKILANTQTGETNYVAHAYPLDEDDNVPDEHRGLISDPKFRLGSGHKQFTFFLNELEGNLEQIADPDDGDLVMLDGLHYEYGVEP